MTFAGSPKSRAKNVPIVTHEERTKIARETTAENAPRFSLNRQGEKTKNKKHCELLPPREK